MKRNIYYLIICLLTLTAVKGQNNEPEKILNTAIYQEEVNGDLQKAIGLYQKIVTSFPENRRIAAKAQFHIGLCYEKLGLKRDATPAIPLCPNFYIVWLRQYVLIRGVLDTISSR